MSTKLKCADCGGPAKPGVWVAGQLYDRDCAQSHIPNPLQKEFRTPKRTTTKRRTNNGTAKPSKRGKRTAKATPRHGGN